MADAKRGKMHARASQLALVLLLIGRKGGANLLSQSHRVESANQLLFDTQMKTALLATEFSAWLKYFNFPQLGG